MKEENVLRVTWSSVADFNWPLRYFIQNGLPTSNMQAFMKFICFLSLIESSLSVCPVTSCYLQLPMLNYRWYHKSLSLHSGWQCWLLNPLSTVVLYILVIFVEFMQDCCKCYIESGPFIGACECSWICGAFMCISGTSITYNSVKYCVVCMRCSEGWAAMKECHSMLKIVISNNHRHALGFFLKNMEVWLV